MFAVDDATADTIRRTFNESGEFAAAVELRQHFRGILDIAQARQQVRIIAGWQPITPPPNSELARHPHARTENAERT